ARRTPAPSRALAGRRPRSPRADSSGLRSLATTKRPAPAAAGAGRVNDHRRSADADALLGEVADGARVEGHRAVRLALVLEPDVARLGVDLSPFLEMVEHH